VIDEKNEVIFLFSNRYLSAKFVEAMRKGLLKTFLKLLIAVILIGIIGAVYLYYVYKSPALNIQKSEYVYLDSNDNSDSLLVLLEKSHGLKHPYFFKKLAEKMNLNNGIKNGRYTVNEKMTLTELIRVFREGRFKTSKLLIRELNTLEKFAAKCGEKLEPDSADFMNVFNDSSLLKELGFNKETVYALLLPDTYEFKWHTSPSELLHRMKYEYNLYWDSNRLKRADSCGLSAIEVNTLASIVAKETNKYDEMPMVAGMYINRIKKGMPLQADPTVKFALNDPGKRRIYFKDLEVVSPYNTYLNPGLPPGPICIPPKKAIEAVLNFVDHTYIFMCAKEDFSGYHNFSSTYAKHLMYARLYRKAQDERDIE
jgi:UPF0755 protein